MPAGRPKTRADGEKYQYDLDYLKQNIVNVGVTFNKRKPEDMSILEWLNSRNGSRAAYIKNLIIEDMKRAGK